MSCLAVFLPIAVAVAIALLRYRLYDIDRLINRALAYGTLTASLAALYFSVVIGAQAVVDLLNREAARSPVIIVASTLLIAALFQPLRQGIQTAIDRRVYRRKYDAQEALATFSATVRQEVDLDGVCERLLVVAQAMMQPVQLSLWLPRPLRHRGVTTPDVEPVRRSQSTAIGGWDGRGHEGH